MELCLPSHKILLMIAIPLVNKFPSSPLMQDPGYSYFYESPVSYSWLGVHLKDKMVQQDSKA